MSLSSLKLIAAIESMDGSPIANLPFEPDLVPAERWAELEHGIGNGGYFPTGTSHAVIEPVWQPEGQPPFISGIRVRVDDAQTGSQFPITYFQDEISRRANTLVESGLLAVGQRFNYRVYAIRKAMAETARNDQDFSIEPVAEPPKCFHAELSRFGDAATSVSGTDVGSEPLPVFFSACVLDEAVAIAAGAGELETGGILVGRLCRDSSGRLFTHVTAQIPARHTEATRESLRFTPQTWVDVRAVLDLRNRDESILGWWHLHPWYCADCPSERRRLCPFSQPQFSAADRALHREVFQAPWNIGLLLSRLGEQVPSQDVFAWRHGRIEQIELLKLPPHFNEKETTDE